MIFDADGTMLDSMQIWSELGKRYLAQIGIKAEKNLSEILYPMTLEESGAYLKKQYRLRDSEEKITKDILSLLRHFYRFEVKAKPGLRSFLTDMKAKQIRMGIATSGDKALLQAALERLGLNDFFSVLHTCSELKTSKREPDIYLKTADAIHALPSQTAVFEDALHGICSAKQGGFITVAVHDRFHQSDKEKILQTADCCIADFNDPQLVRFKKMIATNN